MMQGVGSACTANFGTSSLLAAASAFPAVRRLSSLWPACLTWNSERLFTLDARTEPAPVPAPSNLPQGTLSSPREAAASSSEPSLPVLFSLRPSVLSPLYTAWDHTRRAAHRRDELAALLKSHVLLSASFRAKNDKDLARKVRHRVQQIHKVSVQLGQLLDDPAQAGTVPRCPSPAHAAAYCSSLEELALSQDSAAQDFARVQRGEVSPWAHYSQHFLQPYNDAPRLQPLEVIFSKPDPADIVRRLYGPGQQQQQQQQQQAARGKSLTAAAPAPASTAVRNGGGGGGGPHIDVAGVTHTAGKRKTSSATLDLVPGSGQITVNGLPIASYFREPSFRTHALQPLVLTGSETEYDITVQVHGGGLSGQAQAIRTAVARALVVQRPSLAAALEEYTRWDGRVVERKKPGRAKARRGYTWVKR